MRVDSVAAGAGMVGMMACPQGAAGHAAMVEWRPDVVVTLLPGPDMARLGVADIGAEVAAQGAAWCHLPIADMQTPDPAFEVAWARADLAARLRGGARVLIHCHAGLGRTGTIATRLLIALGAQIVLSNTFHLWLRPGIRAARRGTIETSGQEVYLRTVSPGPA